MVRESAPDCRTRTQSVNAKATKVRVVRANTYVKVTGYFTLDRSVIDKIRKTLGSSYFHDNPAKGPTHRFAVRASSFSDISKDILMLEEIEISHCIRNKYHFAYKEKCGPSKRKDGKPFDFPRDQDVKKILRILGTAGSKTLTIQLSVENISADTTRLRTLSVGKYRLSGVKLALGKDEFLVFDWQASDRLTASVHIVRKEKISCFWPQDLMRHADIVKEVLESQQ